MSQSEHGELCRDSYLAVITLPCFFSAAPAELIKSGW